MFYFLLHFLLNRIFAYIFVLFKGRHSRSLVVASGHFTWPGYDVITRTASTLTRCPACSKPWTSLRDKSSFVSHDNDDIAFEPARDHNIALISGSGNQSHSKDVQSTLGETGKGFAGVVARFLSLVLAAHP